jgi:hypothetical protein
MGRKTRFIMLAVLAVMALVALPVAAGAQPRGGHGPGPGPVHGGGGHVGVYVGGGGYWGYPYWGYPFWSAYWGWGYPSWGYPYPFYGYGGGYYDDSGDIRLQVTPREAQVYVDGYLAGTVDDFDGMFQRLHVRPGSHELTLYLKGYQTVRQDIELSPAKSVKIQYKMQPLAAGEVSEPPPLPVSGSAEASDEPSVQARPPRQAQPAPVQGGPPPGPVEAQGFGSLVLRVQPAGAEILIDGERWQGPEGQERLVVQVAAGAHRVEVRKDGYVPFTAQLRVEPGETAPLNVSLPRTQ